MLPLFWVMPLIPPGGTNVQLSTAPAALVRVTTAEVSPEQRICAAGAKVTTGDGFTVTVTVKGTPWQLPNVGVTVYVMV